MSLKDYLKASVFDFVLCLVISMGLSYINCDAFFVSVSLQYSWPHLILSAAIPLLLMFAAAYSKRTILPGAAVIVVAFVVAVFASNALGGGAGLLDDSTDNPAIFIVITFLSTLATFLLTRRRWMARVFFAVAALDMTFVEFMYKDGHWVALVIVLVALGAMVVFRNYRTNLRDASSTKVSFLAAFGVGTVYAAILAAIACVIFFLIIAPLNPPAKEIKLFTHYMNYETVEMTGTGDASTTSDPDNATSTTTDQKQDTNQDDDEDDSEVETKSKMNPLDSLGQGSLDELNQNGQSSLQDMFNFLIENPQYFVLLIILVILVLASPFVIKKWTRRRWFAKTCALPPSQAVERFFLFFLKRFRILKVRKLDEQTLEEFSEASKGQLAVFQANEANASFADLAKVYSRAVYGHAEPTEEELAAYKAFYKGFYKAFIEAGGRPKYIFRFWRV